MRTLELVRIAVAFGLLTAGCGGSDPDPASPGDTDAGNTDAADAAVPKTDSGSKPDTTGPSDGAAALGPCTVTYSDVSGANGHVTNHSAFNRVGTYEKASGRALFSVYAAAAVDSKIEVSFDGALAVGAVSPFKILQRSISIASGSTKANQIWTGDGSGTLTLDVVGPEDSGVLPARRVRFRVSGAKLQAVSTTSATGSFTVAIECDMDVRSG